MLGVNELATLISLKMKFLSMHSFLFIFNAKNNNSRLQYRNSDFNLDKAVGQSYE